MAREFRFTRKPHPDDPTLHVITVHTVGGTQTDLRLVDADDPGTVPVISERGKFIGWRA